MATITWGDIVTEVAETTLAAGATLNVDVNQLSDQAVSTWLEITVKWGASAAGTDSITVDIHASLDGLTFATDPSQNDVLTFTGAANAHQVGLCFVEAWPAFRAAIVGVAATKGTQVTVRRLDAPDRIPIRRD